MKILIRGCRIADALTEYQGNYDILVADGFIEAVERNITAAADETIDAGGYVVMPGFIDMHAHLRQPGYEKKETVKSGTMAAARGGFTTICCMPNTSPVIDSLDMLQGLMEIIARDGVVNVRPIAAVTKGEKSIELTDMLSLSKNGAIAFSDDGQPVKSARLMREALKLAEENGLLIIDHCEDLSLAEGGAISEGQAAERLGIRGIPALSEELPVMRDIMLAEECGAHIHIAHISTKKSAELVRRAKAKGIKATCEVTPHHIGLTEDIISEGFTDCKVNPPLRTAEDVRALKAALKDGTIDVIATDHAPHHADDKGADFYTAANGISGIETAFPVCYTELVRSGVLTLRELVGKMSYNPAKLLKLDRGAIRAGAAADLVVADLESRMTVDSSRFLSKGRNTPFHGRSYLGEIKYTIVNGNIAYKG